MDSGNVVEYIDREKILCAVVMEIKQQRLRLLTENNREVSLSAGRLLHAGGMRLDLSATRDTLVEALRAIAMKRKSLVEQVDIRELWEVLNTENEWIDLPTMTGFCFPDPISEDQESAVVRAFFKNRLYFKFRQDGFFPHSEAKVQQLIDERTEAQRRQRILEAGSQWLKSLAADGGAPPPPDPLLPSIIADFYLWEKEGQHADLGKALLTAAGLRSADELFPLLVKLGVFAETENIELRRQQIPVAFPPDIERMAQALAEAQPAELRLDQRADLTDLPLMTIDGQATLDFDDALSIEACGGHMRLGVHIVDVAAVVKRGDPIDREALNRASSIYMPDQKISMLPPALAENLCSLKAGCLRPAISILMRIDSGGTLIDSEIVPSVIRVRDQLTYFEVNQMAEGNPRIVALRAIAEHFRRRRLENGAVQISLPEIAIRVDDEGRLELTRINRESPGRMLVSELMILANWRMATFLQERGLPAIFRSQPAPKDRLYKGEEGSLFQHWMQRRLLSRFVLSNHAELHHGLGLEAYLTGSSPIRKYTDLICQRQLRAAFGLEAPYNAEEIDALIQRLEQPIATVVRLQARRHRYWLLTHLQQRSGEKEEAIVLQKRRDHYQVLIPTYMLECDLPAPAGLSLKPQDIVQITIQRVDPRRDVVQVFLG